MVTSFGPLLAGAISVAGLLAAAEQKSEPLLVRLDPESRAKVLMSLLALVLVGVGLVALVWLGGRHLRRIARQRLVPTREHEDDWYRKPLVPDEQRESEREEL